MALVLLFAFAFALGFGAAVPVGPVQIEMAKRAIAGHYRAAMAVVAGSVVSDALYGAVALFGLAPFLETPHVLFAVSLAGTLILWTLAVVTWRKSRNPHELQLDSSTLQRRRWGFVTGAVLSGSNPPIILSWVFGVTLARRLGLGTPLTFAGKVAFVAGGTLGLAGYLAALGAAVHRARHFVSSHVVGRIYAWLAVTLFLLSLYFLHGAVRFLTHG